MSQTTANHQVKSSNNWFVDYANKALGTPAAKSDQTKSKAIEGDGTLGGWLEDAHAYYNSVMSGETARPDPAVWQEFLNQMQWAESQRNMGGGYGDPSFGGDPSLGGDVEPQSNNFGGVQGPNGNWNYDMVQTNLGFTGKDTRNDIYGTANTLNLDKPSASMSFEMTMDHGVEVLKVRVTTSEGEAVYFYDNYTSPDFALTASLPDISKVTGLDGLPADLQAKIKIEKFDPTKKPEEVVLQTEVTGQPVEGQENSYYYVVKSVGDYIDFNAQSGVDETHYIWGEANISVPPDSSVNLETGDFPGANGKKYHYKATVTHADGSTDTIYLSEPLIKDNKHNINVADGSLTVNGQPADSASLPSGFEKLTINGGASGNGGTSGASTEESTPWDELEKNNTLQPGKGQQQTAIYNKSETVDVKANFGDDVDVHEIHAPHVNIEVDSFQDVVTVKKSGNDYIITVDNGKNQEYFYVDAEVAQDVTINGGKITLEDSVKDDPKIKVPGQTDDTVTDGPTPRDILDSLEAAAGGTHDANFVSALQSAGFPYKNIDAVIAAMSTTPASFPPAFSTTKGSDFDKLIHALFALDGDMSGALNSIKGTWDGTLSDPAYATATQKLVTLLKTLYPDHNISMTYPNAHWDKERFITFDGNNFSYAGYSSDSSTFTGLDLKPE